MSTFFDEYTISVGEESKTVFCRENNNYQDGTTPMYRDVNGKLWAMSGHSHKGVINMLVAAITYAESQSMGIVGGADGPTVIFVTQSPDSAVYSMLMSAMILVMSIAGFYYLGHMRKR